MKKYTESKWQDPGYYGDTEHLVFELGHSSDYPNGVVIDFGRQFDDLLISVLDGDVLLAWDVNHDNMLFDEEKCMLLKIVDNMKEIGNLKTSILALRPKNLKEKVKVYLTIQRN